MKIKRYYFLLVPLILIIGSVVFVATDASFYKKECLKLKTDCKKSLLFIDYLDSKGNLSSLPLTKEEKSHMQDVKNLYNISEVILISTSILTLLLLTIFFVRNKKEYRLFIVNYLLYGGLLTVALVVLISVLSLVSFDFLFEIFHKTFFAKGTYLFSQNSTLISLFPQTFFVDASKRLATIAIISSIFFIISGFLLHKKGYGKL